MMRWLPGGAVAALLLMNCPARAQGLEPGATPSAQLPPPVTDDGAGEEKKDEEQEPHEGFFGHLDLGLGYGAISGGALGPQPGFRPIDDLSFSAPVLGASLQVGGGAQDFALAGELLYEVMLTDKEEPSNVGFQMFGIGLAAAYYTDDDYIIGAQLRYLGMLLWREGVPCFWDRAAGASGPGVGVTLGKEWFGRRDAHGERRKGGMGIALQGNYARFSGDADFDYLSLLLQLSMTGF